MKSIILAHIAFMLMLPLADRAWSEPDPQKLSEESQLALDLLAWLTDGCSKFDTRYGGEDQIKSKETIYVIGTAFSSLSQNNLLPSNCRPVNSVDLKSINWEKECYASLSEKLPDGTYTFSVVIGTLGRAIFSVRVLDSGYQIKTIGMS
ncbi:MAG TPA: hypothetical protein PKE26_15405 [Kiritimatiellia bacterium]|nr:hypothetical protein [Kiritimatiellia bacterium]